jgi:hypothetical protein
MMIAEIALLLIGLYALITGRLLNSGGKYVVQGWPARVIGIIGLLPIPVSLVFGIAVAALFVMQGREVTLASFFWVGTAIEAATIVVCVVAMVVLARVWREPVEPLHLPDSSCRFDAPLPTIVNAVNATLRELDVKSVKWSRPARRISGKIGVSFWSPGERLTVAVKESGEVRVQSLCSSSWQLIDWGRNAKNRRSFMAALADRLESGDAVS